MSYQVGDLVSLKGKIPIPGFYDAFGLGIITEKIDNDTFCIYFFDTKLARIYHTSSLENVK